MTTSKAPALSKPDKKTSFLEIEPFFCENARAQKTKLILLNKDVWNKFSKTLNNSEKTWLKSNNFAAQTDKFCIIPDEKGNVSAILVGVDAQLNLWSIAALPSKLPEGNYVISDEFLPEKADIFKLAMGWGLACYRYSEYKKPPQVRARLVLPADIDKNSLYNFIKASFSARDLINGPANLVTPLYLGDAAKKLSKEFGGKCSIISGDDLLSKNYPAIHAVGRASSNPPCLVDLVWGNPKHPKVTLVGKGISFDSGGLDIKTADGMRLMKKDMGGSAVVLSIARLVMAHKLKIRLRVLIAAAENSISSNAFRPLDVIDTRKGLKVEIGNTDAEGRIVLSDALHEASLENPDLVIDCATLTGAARIALGADMPAFFTDNDQLAGEISTLSMQEQEPIWRLPLHKPYADELKSEIADIFSAPSSSYAGAITAALFLKKFAENIDNWVHIDMMAWNQKSRPGRPSGGEAMALRTIFRLLEQKYS